MTSADQERDPELELLLAETMLTNRRAEEILAMAGIPGPAEVTFVKANNHVYRISAGGSGYFLKTYTKAWYGSDVRLTGFCVEHEVCAWDVLRRHGLATPDVVVAAKSCENPLGRPFVVTRELRGRSLTGLLKIADAQTFRQLLETAGAYLRRVHDITFRFPGYISCSGPDGPLQDDEWQHPCWTARQTQRSAFEMLESDRSRLSPDTARRLEELFSTMDAALAVEFEPPRFTHGDCHAGQFFLYFEGAQWHVSGFVDLEVASAGDCVVDLLKLGIELASDLPPSTRWWEPLFKGYGREPDFELFRLRLLGWDEINFKCHGEEKWPRTREEHLKQLLAARTWAELFQN
jgi:aminoglycoside phosphotransferase